MMRVSRYLALPMLLIAFEGGGSLARAEEPKAPQDNTVRYDFDDDAVLGDTVRPLGEVMSVRQRPARESLVRARSSFLSELLQSVEAL